MIKKYSVLLLAITMLVAFNAGNVYADSKTL